MLLFFVQVYLKLGTSHQATREPEAFRSNYRIKSDNRKLTPTLLLAVVSSTSIVARGATLALSKYNQFRNTH